jgi:hypothetical protein
METQNYSFLARKLLDRRGESKQLQTSIKLREITVAARQIHNAKLKTVCSNDVQETCLSEIKILITHSGTTRWRELGATGKKGNIYGHEFFCEQSDKIIL